MFLETIFSFLLILHLRRTLRFFSPDTEWDKLLTRSLYAVVVLFLLEGTFSTQVVTKWVWHLLLLLIVIVAFKQSQFIRARTVIVAVLPLIAVSFFSKLLVALDNDLSRQIKNVSDYAYPVAITWMVALLIVWSRQEKALKKEYKKREAEEEQNRITAARKAELEVMVEERTAELVQQKEELQHALFELKSMQNQLIQSEKMASLGELTAGIAHEIQNPLNFVNNFSEVSVELLDELKNEHLNKLADDEKNKAGEILDDLVQNLEKITHHGKRADAIVKGMLQHSRSSTGIKELTDINALADEYLRLSYHGLRAKDKTFNAIMDTKFDESLPKINVIPQDLGRVILNLFTNAFYAVNEKKKQNNEGYQPTVSVSTRRLTLPNEELKVEICVKDNGVGINQKVIDKIYQPFFSTKPTGQGTGLGLSISYEIITKVHGGEMKVETKEGEYAEFIILLPE